jgi:hypothetical protein
MCCSSATPDCGPTKRAISNTETYRSKTKTAKRILHIEVRGKRGIGYRKSMPGAVLPYKRLRARAKPEPSQTRRARRERDLSR